MKKHYIYAGIAIFLWSTMASVTKLALGNMNSMQVLAASSVFAFVFLLILNLFRGTLKQLKQYAIKDYLTIAGVGSLGILLYHLFLYAGIERMPASQANIINYLWPVMTVAAACVILKEKLTLRKGIAIAMSFVGVIIVMFNGQLGGIDGQTLFGAGCCVLAAVSYGVFCVLNKQARYDKFVSMMLYYLESAVVGLVYVWVAGDSLAMDLPQLGAIAWNGVAVCATAYAVWALALDGDTAKISNLAYITPFLSLVWTYFLLGEPISLTCLLGLGVIVAGIFVQMKEPAAKS